MECPLCSYHDLHRFARVHGRDYACCATCGLVSMAPEYRLDPRAERAHYTLHNNDPQDERYRAFLNRLVDPLTQRISPGACGLDYGSGPGPTLSVMLTEQGFTMQIYDPFFATDRSALDRRYDFITCTEAAEHFFYPGAEFALLDGLLKPGGWLGVMTETFIDGSDFASWWYVRDPTHVSFYRRATLQWIADRFGWHLTMPRPTVALFQKAV